MLEQNVRIYSNCSKKALWPDYMEYKTFQPQVWTNCGALYAQECTLWPDLKKKKKKKMTGPDLRPQVQTNL